MRRRRRAQHTAWLTTGRAARSELAETCGEVHAAVGTARASAIVGPGTSIAAAADALLDVLEARLPAEGRG